MTLLSNAPAIVESLKYGVDVAGNVTIIGGVIGFVLVFQALMRDA